MELILSIILVVIAIIHFNWAIGGEWGFDAALPTDAAGDKVLSPNNFASAVVGIGLTLMALFYLLMGGIIEIDFPNWIRDILKWLIPVIFLMRALGDFGYVGFFKSIRNTKFAQMDSKFYTPLCLIMGLLGLAVIFV